MRNLWLLKKRLNFSLDPPVQANPLWLGEKQVTMLMLRIHARSSGVVIRVNFINKVKKLLLSTNFVGVSTLVTSSDGLTSIHAVWRSKEVPVPYVLEEYGLQVMSCHGNGTPILTTQPWMPYSGEWRLSNSTNNIENS